jgi:hypothetical protein
MIALEVKYRPGSGVIEVHTPAAFLEARGDERAVGLVHPRPRAGTHIEAFPVVTTIPKLAGGCRWTCTIDLGTTRAPVAR